MAPSEAMPSSEGSSSNEKNEKIDMLTAVERYMLTRGESFLQDPNSDSKKVEARIRANEFVEEIVPNCWRHFPPLVRLPEGEQPKGPCLLFRLSNELIREVANWLAIPDKPSALAAFEQTCKLVYDISNPVLYKHVAITEVDGYDHFNKLTNGHIWYGPQNFPFIQKFQLSMPWRSGFGDGLRTPHLIEDMENLQDLAIDYYEGDQVPEFRPRRTIDLSFKLPAKLETFVLTFRIGDCGDWDWRGVVPLLKNSNLRNLEIHSGASDPLSEDTESDDGNNGNNGNNAQYEGIACDSPKSTSLESLTLIDCQLVSDDIQQTLRFPRALKYLSFCWIKPDELGHNPIYIPWEDSFNDIAEEVGKSLVGFRFVPCSTSIPARGINKLKKVRYLEILHHLLAPLSDYLSFNDVDPDAFDHPSLRELLPPRLEVLKIANFDRISPQAFEIISDIVHKKEEVVPCLRRIIIEFFYFDEEEAEELRATFQEARGSDSALEKLKSLGKKDPASYLSKKDIEKWQDRCKAKGVELVALCENGKRREILKYGVGRAVWEIEEQIAGGAPVAGSHLYWRK